MKRNERRKLLLQIMNDSYTEAKDESDFAVEKIAEIGGVSKVWVYRLIGLEYRKLRLKLRKRKDSSTKVQSLQHPRIPDCPSPLQDITTIYGTDIANDLNAAIKCIELLDEQNRGLRGLLKIYQRRLIEAGLLIEPSIIPKSISKDEQQELKVALYEGEHQEKDIAIESGHVIENPNDYSN